MTSKEAGFQHVLQRHHASDGKLVSEILIDTHKTDFLPGLIDPR